MLDRPHPGWKADSFLQPLYLKYVEMDAALDRLERQLIQQKILACAFSPGDTIKVGVKDGAFVFG